MSDTYFEYSVDTLDGDGFTEYPHFTELHPFIQAIVREYAPDDRPFFLTLEIDEAKVSYRKLV